MLTYSFVGSPETVRRVVQEFVQGLALTNHRRLRHL